MSEPELEQNNNSAAHVNSDQEMILLVDDDPLILKVLQLSLEREGYLTLTANSGVEAIECLEKSPIAVIICDQRMPHMTGIQVLTKAQEVSPDTIRILLTGNVDLETVTQAINIGQIYQFITKPWDDSYLHQTVRTSVEKYRLLKENEKLQNLILSQHKSLAENHDILRSELLLGRRIHDTLLVGKLPPKMPGISIAATSIPSQEIDGDFFEFFCPMEMVFDVVMGDVMGKGLPAALVGTAVKAQLMRFALPISRRQVFEKHQQFWNEDLLSPPEILSNVHQQLASQLIRLEYFVCLFYGRFNLAKRTLTFSDCGSTKPLHYIAAENKIRFLKGTNFSLGMVESERYESLQIPFAQGDFFVFYSDGITEARSLQSELFGVERLVQIVQDNAHLGVKDLLDTIKSSVLNFSHHHIFDDDLTLIIIRIDHCKPFSEPMLKTGKFTSHLSQLQPVRTFIEQVCMQAPGDAERLSDQVKLAINEIFCNIVLHGHKKSLGEIIIQAELATEGIIIEISDQGLAFDPAQVLEPSLAGDRSEGFGLYIAKQIGDELVYVRKTAANGWNHFRFFKKYIPKEEQMKLSHHEQNDILIITPEVNSIDAKGAPEFKEKVISLISSNDKRNVVFDLQQLQFIDSSGLGSFLSVLRTLHSIGGELKLARMNKPIRTMFELVSMHKIFEIYNSTEEAVKSFHTMS